MKKPTLLSWSSGKDSAWALHCLREDPAVEVAGLFTVINEQYERASMHATRIELLRRQAEAAGLPLDIIGLPNRCSMEQCDAVMADHVRKVEAEGIECIAFGDLYLEEIRHYREKQLEKTALTPLFPLWQIPTELLARQMLDNGMTAYVSSVDLSKLPADFAGRKWDRKLLDDLPPGCDPCGENGEMHTIVTAGPMFASSIAVRLGEVLTRDGFAYADIMLAE